MNGFNPLDRGNSNQILGDDATAALLPNAFQSPRSGKF